VTRQVQPSRTTKDFRPADANAIITAAGLSLDDAAALTAGWDRRRLLDVCLTLAAWARDEPAIEERPIRLLDSLGPRYTEEEAAWTDTQLRTAHLAYKNGVKTPWTTTGERLYLRLAKRRNRPALRDLAVGDDRHGTRNGYEIGCRCRPCTDAKAAHKRAGRARGWAS
jgi:hypothetical protein